MSALTGATLGELYAVGGWVPLALMGIGVATISKWWARLVARMLFGPRTSEARYDSP